MNFNLLIENLTNPALLFFALGVIAVYLKSDLEIDLTKLNLKDEKKFMNDFFEKRENGWYHAKCEKIIKKYHSQAVIARENGKKEDIVGLLQSIWTNKRNFRSICKSFEL